MTKDEAMAVVKQEGQTVDEVFPDPVETEGESEKTEDVLPEPDQEGKETSQDSPTETKPEGETQSSEGDNSQDVKDEPFHKRWKEQRDKLNREWEERLNATVQQFEEKLDKFQKVDSVQQVPNWVKKIYGDGQDAVDFYKEYRADQDREAEAIKSRLLAEQKAEAERTQKEAQRWTGWVNEQVQELRDEGLVFDENQLKKIALDFMPTDSDGNIDFRKAYQLYEMKKASETNPAQSEARRRLAAATTSKPSPETKAEEFQTPQTLRNKSFSQLIREQ